MSHKRPTESSWDSDDDILEDDVSGLNAFTSEKDEDFDEDALLGPTDDEDEGIDEQFTQDDGEEENLGTESYQDGQGGDMLEIEVEEDFDEEETTVAPVLELPDTSEFDEEPDQFQGSSFEEPPHYEEPVQSQSRIEENVYEQEPEVDTTQEFDESIQEEDKTNENIKEEEDDDDEEESDDEDSGRRGRFVSERAATISLKRSTADTKKDIPDTLELSQADQQKIDDFLNDKQYNKRGGRGSRGRMNQRGRGMQPFGQRPPRDNNFRPRGPNPQVRYQFQPRPQHFERPPYMGFGDNINIQHDIRPRTDFMPISRPVEPLMPRDNFNKPAAPQRQHPLDFFEKAQQRVQQPRKILINPNFRGTVQLQGNAVLTPAWSGQNTGIRGATGGPQFPAPQNNQPLPNRSQDFRDEVSFQGRPFIDNNRGPMGQNQQQMPLSRPSTSQAWGAPPIQQPPRQMLPSRSQSTSTFTPAPIPQQPLNFNNQPGMAENQRFQPIGQHFNRPNLQQNNPGFPQRSNSAGDMRFPSTNIEGNQIRPQFQQQNNNRLLGPQGGRPFQENGPGSNQRFQTPQTFNQQRPGLMGNGNQSQFSHEQQRFNQPYRPQQQPQPFQQQQQQQLQTPQQHNQQQHPRYQPPRQPNMPEPVTPRYQEYNHGSVGEPIRTIGSPQKPLAGQRPPLSQRPQFQNDQPQQQQQHQHLQHQAPNNLNQTRPNQQRPPPQAWQNNNNQMQRQTAAQIAANKISKNAQKRRSGEQQVVTTPEKKSRMSVKNRLGNKQSPVLSEKPEEKASTPVAETKLAPELGVDEEYAKKLEQQKRLREEVRKKKEMRRLATAGPRRQELAVKLAQKGMTFDDAAKGVPKQPEPLMNVQTPIKTLPPRPANTATAQVQVQVQAQAQGQGQQNQVKRLVVNRKKMNELMEQGYNIKIMNKGKKVQPASNLVGQPIQSLYPSHQQQQARTIQPPNVRAPGVRPQQRPVLRGNQGLSQRFPGPTQKRLTGPAATQGQRKVVNPMQESNNGGRRVVVAGGNNPMAVPHGTKLVGIENLSTSTTSKRLHQLCGNVGPTEIIQMNNGMRKAVVKFINPNDANMFAQKFNRKMVDLSMISVALLQEND